ncbi:MAG: outer membrane protein transport protein [Deltaproteobacteria bacterium]|nr:outer membrane protein transport protein [Deltaproteobacteria bacterium]
MYRATPWNIIILFFLVFSVLCTTSAAYGSGFGIFTQGASALGQADAVVAHTDEPSAIFFNPALINDLPGTQMELGTTLIFPSREFKSNLTGTTSDGEDTVYYPSTFFISHSFNDTVSAGVGVFNPFGLGTEWDDDWEGRYIATQSEITTYTVNPVLSYRITPRVSFAAGVDFLWFDTTLKKKINLNPYPDAKQKFSGDGSGIGYNLGILVNISDSISLGTSYRSKIDVDIDGDASFNLPSPLLIGVFPNTGGKTDITLPQQVFAGISYMASDQLTLEGGFRWEDWSSFKELTIDLDQPIGGQTSMTEFKNWDSTYAVNIGAKYKLNEVVSLLAGYLYSENPVPDDTVEPSIPDSDTHLFCVGTDMKFKKFKIAMSYAYQLQEDRNKNNFVGGKDPSRSANGRYETELHLLGLSLAYRF